MLKARHSWRTVVLVLCWVSSTTLLPVQAQTITEPQRPTSPDANVILEVINNHFTIGQKIPSVYLKLFSDGTAECHILAFSGREEDVVKRRTLTAAEFAKAKATLNLSVLRDVTGRYEIPRTIADSWMEWDITIHTPELRRDVTVSFGLPSEDSRPYPRALAELGCLILKLREEAYGDNTGHYRPACNQTIHPQR